VFKHEKIGFNCRYRKSAIESWNLQEKEHEMNDVMLGLNYDEKTLKHENMD
jgi:hypothetical protein